MPTRERSWRPTRRDLLASSLGTACAAAAGSLPAGGVFSGGSDRIRIGLIGCGGRGTGAARQAATWHPAIKIVAMGDLFSDHVTESAQRLEQPLGEQFDCPPERRFIGHDAWRQVVEADLDAVILAAAPWSRPAHFAAAVARGLHIYCERPAAIDIPGMRSILAAVSDARARGLVVVSGLAGRHHAPTIETIARIHDGAIGPTVGAVCSANLGLPWHRPMRSSWSADAFRHRNWVTDPSLSGGPLVESHLDALDRGLWVMNDACPVTASPTASNGGLAIRYRFADGRELHADIMRSAGAAGQREEIVRGSRGAADLIRHRIVGEQPWQQPEGSVANPWQACMGSFVNALVTGGRGDGGIPLARSNLVALLGRIAIESGHDVNFRDVAVQTGGTTDII